ncbi:MAG: DMT family transporter [Dehalococcoidia bacterium]|nr:DMT family transporter [Dehalococcoidia bacterium]
MQVLDAPGVLALRGARRGDSAPGPWPSRPFGMGGPKRGWAYCIGARPPCLARVCALISLDLGVPAGIVALVTALQPLLTGTLSGPVLGERTDAWQWLGLILGFCGVVIAVGARLSTGDATIPIGGYLVPFGSVVAITAASLLQRRCEPRRTATRLPDDTVLLYRCAATALAFVASRGRWRGSPPR